MSAVRQLSFILARAASVSAGRVGEWLVGCLLRRTTQARCKAALANMCGRMVENRSTDGSNSTHNKKLTDVVAHVQNGVALHPQRLLHQGGRAAAVDAAAAERVGGPHEAVLWGGQV